ncbi:hypothetical protein [Aliterella atlantica]|uniref:Uncharacterized protein n=1 Tax=Aliterella atlantica CENA595 TaxID=1618023 RepID=A0A0D8ZQT5_9CYAN|nr:hypothetical protein [Aliterella atlantica]KJH69586.1 hypothetical protein UH38_22875 [Aliterella atlantica CENA595]
MKFCSLEVCFFTTSIQLGAIAFMGMPVAVACAKPDGVCHNLRVMALETRKTVLLPQMWWDKLTRRH